jgi:hypothetical protein
MTLAPSNKGNRARFNGQPQLLLLVWMVVRLAMPILIERMSA